MRGLFQRALIGACAAVTLVAVPAAVPAAPIGSKYDLANRCFALRSVAAAKFLRATEGGYEADAARAQATPFFFEPTGLGTYMLYAPDRRALGIPSGSSAAPVAPGPAAQWEVRFHPPRSIQLELAGDRRLARAGAGGELVARAKIAARAKAPDPRTTFELVKASGCARFPDAEVNARGKPFRGTTRGGAVSGFADLHLHITSDMRAGGQVIYGAPFNPFGIEAALGRDSEVHGPGGYRDVTGNLLRDGVPFGGHDNSGWPVFAGWPTHDTNTHQQTYYRWLERAWMAGERLVVAQAVEDQPICEIEPRRSHSCDETETIRAEIAKLRALERYVDAQNGGPGEGWFRIVRSPRAARRVIERGKLAVVIGVESSNLFGCSEFEDRSQCDHADVRRGIRLYQRLGVSSVFIAHWTDNAFAGAALEGGAKGAFINVFNRHQTGEWFETAPCPRPGQGEEVEPLSPVEATILATYFPAVAPLALEPPPSYPEGRQCNAKGLTPLGAYLVKRLIEAGMLIEVDHMSERARAAVMRIAARRDYPLVSSHNGTGGPWTDGELRRLLRGGGIAAATPAQAPELAERIAELARHGRRGGRAGVPLGTDTGGFSSLPGPGGNGAPLSYPYRSHEGGTLLSRQITGERTFDLNTDGVAHYGLFPDLIAAMDRGGGGRRAARLLFDSAEAYLRMWGRAVRVSERR